MSHKSETEVSNNRYGPQTKKLEDLVEKVKANFGIYVSCNLNWAFSSHHDLVLDPIIVERSLAALRGIRAESLISGREKIYAELSDRFRPGLVPSFMAIVLEDRIGNLFTQEDYDFLVSPISDFLEVMNKTEPNTPLRDLVADLLETMTGFEAVVEARRVLYPEEFEKPVST